MLSGILKAIENLKVFSNGLLTLEVENKYETLRSIWFIINPVPKVKENTRKRAKPISHTIVPTIARPLYHLLEESLPSLYNK